MATLGPATDTPGVLDALMAAGMDCARLNCSHGDADDLRRRAGRGARGGCAAGPADRDCCSTCRGRSCASRAREPQTVAVGDIVVRGAGRRRRGVPVDFDKFAALVTERSQIVIGDGVPRFAVERVDGPDVVARAVSPGPLSARKGINVTYARPELPAITDKDVADLGLAAELGADFIALSFVRSAADIELLRELAARARAPPGWWPRSRRSRPTRRSTRSSTSPTA